MNRCFGVEGGPSKPERVHPIDTRIGLRHSSGPGRAVYFNGKGFALEFAAGGGEVWRWIQAVADVRQVARSAEFARKRLLRNERSVTAAFIALSRDLFRLFPLRGAGREISKGQLLIARS